MNKDFFKNDNPIVLELGCGKGEYTVGLAKNFPEKNYLGIDIKGARIWAGASQALEEKLINNLEKFKISFTNSNIEPGLFKDSYSKDILLIRKEIN